MKILNRWFTTLATLVAISLITGCATSGNPAEQNDPFEKFNRSVLTFNLESDRLLLKPVAKAYDRPLPQPVKTGVNNFFSNLWEPMTIANDLLQGKIGYAAQDTMRFVANSTLGVAGIFDVAKDMNMPRRKEDFGQTLAVWGVPEGPYLMLPLLGPSTLRDAAGLIPQYQYGDLVSGLDSPERIYAGGLRAVDTRSRLLDAEDVFELQPDKYLFLREVYRSDRENLIYDGDPPAEDGEDSGDGLIDELLEDEQE